MASTSLLTWIISRQPFKAVFVLFALALNAAKLPWWLLYFLPRSLRQHASYSWGQAVRVEILRNYLRVSTAIRVHFPLKLVPGAGVKDPSRFVRIDPSTATTTAPEGTRYTGVVISSKIRPTAVFGIWYPAAPSAATLEQLRIPGPAPPLILHFHGGAFAVGDPRPEYSGFIGGLLSSKIGPTLCASYRLASNPGGAFPAALQDAISAYAYVLTELRIPAHRVVISGDSAGANLAIALLRYIAQYPEAGLQAPGAALLFSPWVDVSAALDQKSIPSSPYAGTDYLTANFAHWGASSIQPDGHLSGSTTSDETAVDGPWISPRAHAFRAATPIWVQAGGLEVLSYDIAAFVQGMQKIDGNSVDLFIEPVANHDVVLVAPVLGFERAADHIADEASKWLSSTLKG